MLREQPEVAAGEDREQHETDEREDGLSLQVVRRVAGCDRRPSRAGAVHHHESEGDEAERDEDEQALLDVRAAGAPASGAVSRPCSQRRHQRAEALAALLEVRELVVARTGRREQDDLARARIGEGRAHGRLEVAAADERDALRRERVRDLSRRSRRSGRPAQRRRSRARAARARAKGVPLRLPPRITRRPGGYAPRPRSADSGFVAFESLTKRTPLTAPTGSRRCGTPGNVAQRLGDRLVREARPPAPRRSRLPRSPGCARRGSAARPGARRRRRTRSASPARASARSHGGRRPTSLACWFSKMRSLAAR